MIDLPQLPRMGYVIYDKDRNLFSKGGNYVYWTKKGKIWSTLGGLKNHLAMFISQDYVNGICEIGRANPYSLIDPERYIIIEISTNTVICTVMAMYRQMTQKRGVDWEKRQIKELKIKQELLDKELEKLKGHLYE